MTHTPLTLTDYILQDMAQHPDHKVLLEILADLAHIGKQISHQTSRAGLVDVLGSHGATNIQGEDVQKLDVIANELCKQVFTASHHFISYASEEEDEVVDISDNATDRYVIAFDPLDGSSNIDVNGSIGTIFSVYKGLPDVPPDSEAHFLQPGKDQVLAGYILYGASTVLVFTFQDGPVHECTLDPDLGTFFVSQESLTIPDKNPYYSLNEAHLTKTEPHIQHGVAALQQEGASSRYIGSFVADIHRTLLKGGVFLYPGVDSTGTGEYKGKLRINYELKPIALLVAHAGGISSDGSVDILEKESGSLHERCPYIAGTTRAVTLFLKK